ncbi:hypothetical protein A3A05_00180 [Candidatus Nomurabacteria bacterium RIFCSPLOWO2_01_FULL_41_12]|uniref:Response regulatory domain-containing protein n=1 Tax=Candidatus Nomurabacteria bacterium RIFCSPLOWO2_01_FULL_41_12 TaxID=1801774 RepID=A0A1F6WXC2_9BACT|nr:MAG: hypothetical protein A3A05_00180 [Candidatus Nomurabacteria bacterium RIFCSPLOWO2_01_FULL_41_12]
MTPGQNIKEEKLQVFVIEDDVLLNRAYNAKFEHENIKAVFATDGDEALEMLSHEENHPKLIILDLMLPKRSGFEVLEIIKKDPKLKDIPVIILSNLSLGSDSKRGLEAGAVEYITKADIKIADIVAKVKKYL